ncbi:hypothetical protein BN14_09909 [Rhizoctonia solani AG-1 IB]|uniref:Uncharacterized protein n=1 Tax=Thanatephorus cucumeris (strain AG1-IB / isolate 7/3/14) TaxID=1108050 RepID=M5C8W7_THACB|nr:hypothetical protein BN14_09909 [Rhizoctonia solani AG-1 IB]
MPAIRSNSNSTAAVDAGRSESSATVSCKKKRTTKNKKLGLVDRLVPVGKYMCRMVSFNWNIHQTLDQGLARIACALPEEEKDLIQGATDKDKGFDRCWDELIKITPYVPNLVMNCNAIDLVEMTFDYAKITSRAEDNSKFKKGVASWRTWSPPLPKGKKGRGFAYPECQRMLCPISVNFADPNPFNYGQYYTDILEYLEDPIFQDMTDELLEWWDREIFPDAHHACQNPDLSGFSMIERMQTGLASSDTEDAQSEAAEFQEVPLE